MINNLRCIEKFMILFTVHSLERNTRQQADVLGNERFKHNISEVFWAYLILERIEDEKTH
jgi:hypothetical protein